MAKPDKQTLGRIQRFLDKLPEDPEKFALQLEAIETISKINQAQEKADAELDIRRDDEAARLRLLSRITWTVMGVVSVDMVLLAGVLGASIFLDYKADAWLVRLLASGPPTSIVGMLAVIVRHYWRSGKSKK